ncbi:DIP1984 family protein [Acinetobacter sp. B5B]|uniref:DIP1984 family protein n=1 Tax=Acinetobacter baretiae TaxID=2605383 RepID=UPI0018C32D4D|nr:DIP1984 family protein [Acinetobacter baretiae]MBF7683490.1 DIP1984 family protein [Acinetobacter baretiae]
MKLAEALLIRSDQQKKISSLKQRINNNVLVQEGNEPSEDPHQLLIELFNLISEQQKLIYKINLTNANTMVEHNTSLLELIMQRDAAVERHKVLMSTIEHAHREPDRYSSREIKWNKTVIVSKLQKQGDDIASKIRDLNIHIQATNWNIELINDIKEA